MVEERKTGSEWEQGERGDNTCVCGCAEAEKGRDDGGERE